MVALALIPALGRQRQWISESSSPAWSTKQVLEQPRLHSKTISRKKKKKDSTYSLGSEAPSGYALENGVYNLLVCLFVFCMSVQPHLLHQSSSVNVCLGDFNLWLLMLK